jgi:S1-C subfamily serine protease
MRLLLALAVSAVSLQPPPSAPLPSPERPGALVRAWFEKYLKRPADQASVHANADALRDGLPPDAVLGNILASQEYYEKAGGTPQGWVNALLADVLGPGADRQEADRWSQLFALTDQVDEDRAWVARRLLRRHPDAIYLRPARPERAIEVRELGMNVRPEPDGVRVTAVAPDTTAAQLGLTPGDLIAEFDRQPLRTFEQLQAALARAADGGEHAFTLLRREQALSFSVRVQNGRLIVGRAAPAFVPVEALGALVRPVPEGLAVHEARAGTVAATAGLRPGDVILAADGRAVQSADQLRDALLAGRPNESHRVVVAREGRELFFAVRPANGRLALHHALAEMPEFPAGALGGMMRMQAFGLTVTQVPPNSLAAQLGFAPGDLLMTVAGRPVRSPQQLQEALADGSRKRLEVDVRRGNTRLEAALQRAGDQLRVRHPLRPDGVE